MRILLIEDHQRLANSIVEGLAGFGFGVDLFATAEEGLAASKSISYDAIVLDLGLPDRDGLDLIPELHTAVSWMPILILTARDGIDDRVEGLDRGADDYLLKPFAMKELAARLRALLRRPGGPLTSACYQCGGFGRRTCLVRGERFRYSDHKALDESRRSA